MLCYKNAWMRFFRVYRPSEISFPTSTPQNARQFDPASRVSWANPTPSIHYKLKVFFKYIFEEIDVVEYEFLKSPHHHQGFIHSWSNKPNKPLRPALHVFNYITRLSISYLKYLKHEWSILCYRVNLYYLHRFTIWFLLPMDKKNDIIGMTIVW